MIIRVVRMTFKEEGIDSFLKVFSEAKENIRAFPGCHHLELWQDEDTPNIFMTYSYWDSPEALENYRHSELFKNTWSKTKPLFSDKPTAFSAQKRMEAKGE